MVRILALLFTLWSGPVLAQAEFSTIISPVLGTSPLAVTVGASPFGVICVSGCAAGASPSSVIVTNTPTVSLSTSPAVVNIGTIPTVTTSAVAGAIAVNINNTPTVSLASSPFVQQGTNPWTVNGTVTTSAVAGAIAVNVNNTPTVSLASSPFVQQGTSPWVVTSSTSPIGIVCVSGCGSAGASPSSVIASLSTSAPYVNINTIPTVTTSAVAGAVAVNINNTPTVSLSTSAPFVQQGTATWTVNLPTSPITVGTMTSGAVTTVMAAGTSALAVTPLISPMAVIVTSSFTNVVSPLAVIITSQSFVTLTTSPQPVVATSAAVTNVMAAGTSPLAVTLTSSPTAIAEQNGLAYPNRANWKQGSVTTTGTASAVVIPAPAANKLYITALQCWRSDAGTSPMTMKFNDPAAQFVVAVGSNGNNMFLNPALVMSATTSLQFSASTSLTSVGCNAQGYNAP